jgi:hypothetical protein
MEREPSPKSPESGFENPFASFERKAAESEAKESLKQAEKKEAEEERSKERKSKRKQQEQTERQERKEKSRLERATDKVRQVLARIFEQPTDKDTAERQIEAAADEGETRLDPKVSRLRRRLAEIALEARQLVARADERLDESESALKNQELGTTQPESEATDEEQAAKTDSRTADESEPGDTFDDTETDPTATPVVTTGAVSGAGPPPTRSKGTASGGGQSGSRGTSSGLSGGGLGGPHGSGSGSHNSPSPWPTPSVPLPTPTSAERPSPEEKKSNWVPPFLLGGLTGWWLGRRGPKREIEQLERDIHELSQSKQALEVELAVQHASQPDRLQPLVPVPPDLGRELQFTHAAPVTKSQEIQSARREPTVQGEVAEIRGPRRELRDTRFETRTAERVAPKVARVAVETTEPKAESRVGNQKSETSSSELPAPSPDPEWVSEVRRAVLANRPILDKLTPEQHWYLEKHDRTLFERARSIQMRTQSPEIKDVDDAMKQSYKTVAATGEDIATRAAESRVDITAPSPQEQRAWLRKILSPKTSDEQRFNYIAASVIVLSLLTILIIFVL